MSLIFVVAALICFIIGAIPSVGSRVNLVAAGLACFMASILVGRL